MVHNWVSDKNSQESLESGKEVKRKEKETEDSGGMR